MTNARKVLLSVLLAAATALPLAAYDNILTHPHLTRYAVQKSVLYQDPTLLFALGLAPTNFQEFYYRARFDDSTWFLPNIPYSIDQLVGEGAYDEDLGTSALNHFYDPVNDRPLTVWWNPITTVKSWVWETEANGPIAGQDFSLADARGYLRDALTYNAGVTPVESSLERDAAMEEMFLALGHGVHHIEDMAQPQHVRNDQHLDLGTVANAILPFTNPSRYERYTALRDANLDAYAAAAGSVFPGSDVYKTDPDFWFNGANVGIAQYTNNNFVSEGTNFLMRKGQAVPGPYALPVPGASTDFTPAQLYGEVNEPIPAQMQSLCGQQGADCTMTMYSTAVSARASTLSIFDQDLRATGLQINYNFGDPTVSYVSDRLFALNRFNFDDAHKSLIGQAVSYSTGLINHFFRGKLNVTAPPSGPYAVADQSTGQGFTKVFVTVANATPGEALSGGTFQAIAHFHRNGCYKPDLSGEFTETNGTLNPPPCPNYRTEESYVKIGTTGDATALDVGASIPMTFTFADPIPFDATDLIIQVYYQGTVGPESNSFALGAVDVSEPTFVAIMNATDNFELSGTAFYYPQDIVNNITQSPYSVIDVNHNGVYDPGIDVNPYGGDIAYEIRVNGVTVGTIPTLNQGRFSRIAVLVDPTTAFELAVVSVGNGFDDLDVYSMPPKIGQIDYSRAAFIVTPVSMLRSQELQWDSVSYYHYYPTTGASLDLMLVSQDPSATTPVPVQMSQ